MLLLDTTSDVLRLVTSGTPGIDVFGCAVDMNPSNSDRPVPVNQATAIASAATTTIFSAPASGVYRTVKVLTIRNKHATTSNTVTVEFYNGTTAYELVKAVLPAGFTLHYHEAAGFWVTDAAGSNLMTQAQGTIQAAVNSTNLVVLSADVINNNAVANTIASVTGLSFAVTAGQTYVFRFTIDYTAAATTTGSRWSISGPAVTRLAYRSQYSLTTTSETVNSGLTAYDLPAASNATSAATGGNTAIVEGVITPSADGTVIARCASEVTSSAITAKAGSLLKWYRTL